MAAHKLTGEWTADNSIKADEFNDVRTSPSSYGTQTKIRLRRLKRVDHVRRPYA